MRRRKRSEIGIIKRQIDDFVHQLRLIISNVRLFGINYPRVKPMSELLILIFRRFTHTAKGAHYINNLDNIPKLATLVAMEHHIYYDGTGYPDLGKDWKTHIVSQMITIADVFDAMRSKRLYQEARPEKNIFEVLREGRGIVYNPFLVDNFLRILNVRT